MDAALKETFRPEFLNRVDEIVEFKTLTNDELKQIAELMLKDIKTETQSLGAELNITENAKNAIVTEGYVYKYGARPMRRTIQNYIENPIAEMVIAGDIREGSVITVDTDENGKIRCMI